MKRNINTSIKLPTDTHLLDKDEYITTNLDELLSKSWISIAELDNCPNISFRCIIKFDEFGLSDVNHISMGYWWHIDKRFTIDNVEMRTMTPKYFIPQTNVRL